MRAPAPTMAPAPAREPDLPFPGTGSLRRRVLRLAWPAIGEHMSQTLVGIVDTLLVARLGAEALAGVGSAFQVMMLVIGVLAAVSVGASILVAQATGAADRRRANTIAKQAIVWGTLLSVPLSVAGWALAAPIAGWLGLPPEVAEVATAYLQVTLGGSLFLVLMFVTGGILRGAGDSRTPMLTGIIANILNASLAWLLIFGHFGLPELGAQGSAWAALTGRAVATLLLLGALASGRRIVSVRRPGNWRPDLELLRRILGLGVPAALEQGLITLGFTWFTAIMATQGAAVLAAQRIAFNALSLSFLPGLGFAIATTALVGMSVGAKRVELGGAAAAVAARWTVAWMGGVATLYFVLATPILGLFTTDPLVQADGAAMLRLIAFAQPGWALVFVFSGALRGLGNTRFPLLVNTGCVWLIVIFGYVLLNYVGTSAVTAWVGFVIASPLMGGLAWWRFNRAVAHWPRATP